MAPAFTVISPVLEYAQSRSHLAAIWPQFQFELLRKPGFLKSATQLAARTATSAVTASADRTLIWRHRGRPVGRLMTQSTPAMTAACSRKMGSTEYREPDSRSNDTG